MLFIGCCLPVDLCGSLFAVCCAVDRCFGCCLLCVVRCRVFVVCCSLVVVRCVLFVVCCSLCGVCCLLSGVCLLFFCSLLC